MEQFQAIHANLDWLLGPAPKGLPYCGAPPQYCPGGPYGAWIALCLALLAIILVQFMFLIVRVYAWLARKLGKHPTSALEGRPLSRNLSLRLWVSCFSALIVLGAYYHSGLIATAIFVIAMLLVLGTLVVMRFGKRVVKIDASR